MKSVMRCRLPGPLVTVLGQTLLKLVQATMLPTRV